MPGAPPTPGGDKPQSLIAREFEVRYHVVFHPPVVAPPTGKTGGVGGIHGGTTAPPGGVVSGGTQPTPPPCIKF